MNKKNIISSIIFALLLTALWFYIYQDLSDNDQENFENQEETATTTPSQEGNNSISLENDKNIVIDVIKDEPNLQAESERLTIIEPIPDLERKIVFGDDFSEQEQQIMTNKIDELVQRLKDDPTSLEDWLYLGLNRKMIGDYEGAKEAWEYAKLVSPDNFVVRGNLGDLYAYYLKDNEKAELNYKEALERGPSQVYLYFKTVEFYRDFLNDISKAKEVAQTGFNITKSPDIQALIDSL